MDTNAIKSNLIYRFLYFPDNGLSDYFIDLSWINSYPRFAILERQREGIINKIGSLNNFGYYLFLSKLTVHLMRPEDVIVQQERAV